MYGEPKDVPGECNAHLYIADNHGDNHATIRCMRKKGHTGKHTKNYGVDDGNPVTIEWVQDQSFVCEVHGRVDKRQLDENEVGCEKCWHKRNPDIVLYWVKAENCHVYIGEIEQFTKDASKLNVLANKIVCMDNFDKFEGQEEDEQVIEYLCRTKSNCYIELFDGDETITINGVQILSHDKIEIIDNEDGVSVYNVYMAYSVAPV